MMLPDVKTLPPNRETMEKRYGKLKSGRSGLTINDWPYLLDEILAALGLNHEDVIAIDAHYLPSDTYAIRYIDLADRVIVAYEFNNRFEYVGEMRVHLAEWMGDEAYFAFPWYAGCLWPI